jgi:microcystin-dependent protein
MTLWKWSRTASSNASADASINWSEGQPPSSVNDSARAMMAATAKYRDDIAGATLTSGTSTAYTMSTWQLFDSLAHLDGTMLAFTPHATNGAVVTLNVDSIGAKPLRAGPNVELPSGTLIQGTPYVATYNGTDGAFYLQGGASNPYNIPVGGLLPYVGGAAPNSAFALPYGQAVSRAAYAALFSIVGATFGSGDGSTTFNLPDLRGRVIAGLDNMGGSSASRLNLAISSTTLGAVGGEQQHTLTGTEMPSHTHTTGGNSGSQNANHTHTTTINTVGAVNLAGGGAATVLVGSSGTPVAFGSSIEAGQHQHDMTSTTSSTGSSGGHNNVQPTMVANFILRII